MSAALLASMTASAVAEDWIFDNGPYTRSEKTGERVDQYQKIKDPKRIPASEYFAPNGPHPWLPSLMESETPGGMWGFGFGYDEGWGFGGGWGGGFGPVGF